MHQQNLHMKVYLSELGEPVGGEEWEVEVQRKLQMIKLDIERELDFEVEVSSENLGAGTDWVVVAIKIASIAGSGFFLIPAAHKRIREAIEEWGRIFNNFRKLRRWLDNKYSVTMHSPGYSFINAIDRLDARNELQDAIFLDYSTLSRRDFFPVLNETESADQVFVIGVKGGLRIFIYDHKGNLRSERIIDLVLNHNA